MKTLVRLLVVAFVVAAVVFVIKKLLKGQGVPQPLPSEGDLGSTTHAFDESELGGPVSQELLDILVCPEDRGPLTLSDDGKWLINPRNGYRYPIRNGIPVMLIEEGRKHRDMSLVQEPVDSEA